MAVMNQLQLLHDYNKNNKYKFNPDLFVRSDDDVIDELKKIILSCQRDNRYFTIKVVNFTVVEDYNQINQILYNYYDGKTKNKSHTRKKDNKYSYIDLKGSDIKLLIVKYFIKAKDEEEYLDVIIEVPRIVDKYYFRIGGILYSALYQIVDGSTYNNSTSTNAKNPSITMKIVFMATRVYRITLNMKTVNDEDIKINHYISRIFSKSVAADKYILAKYGFYDGLRFIGVKDIYVTKEDIQDENYYTFKRAEGIYINAPKILVDNDPVTQSVVATLYRSIIPCMPFEMIFSKEFWVRSLGGDFNNYTQEKMLQMLSVPDTNIVDTIDKGYSILDSFENIYDISTRDSIRLPFEDKADMYCIIRWIMREFNWLKAKDNLDISIKKIRYAHYIASLYAMKIVKGIYRVADMNKKATIPSIKKAIDTNPNYLPRTIVKCKLVNYRNMVNDMDALTAIKYTYKGISGLGGNNSNAIPDIFRAVHVSHLGRVDLDSSSNTDPGITGTLCPFAKTYDNYFSDYQEPNYWEQEFKDLYDTYRKSIKLIEPLEFMDKILGQTVSDEDKELIQENTMMLENVIREASGVEQTAEYFTVEPEEISAALKAALI